MRTKIPCLKKPAYDSQRQGRGQGRGAIVPIPLPPSLMALTRMRLFQSIAQPSVGVSGVSPHQLKRSRAAVPTPPFSAGRAGCPPGGGPGPPEPTWLR